MNSNKYTLDRYEDGFAVLLLKEDESVEKIVPEESLNANAKEGDVLVVSFDENDKIKNFTILEQETKELSERVTALIDKLKMK